jgi:hypothetical protein
MTMPVETPADLEHTKDPFTSQNGWRDTPLPRVERYSPHSR